MYELVYRDTYGNWDSDLGNGEGATSKSQDELYDIAKELFETWSAGDPELESLDFAIRVHDGIVDSFTFYNIRDGWYACEEDGESWLLAFKGGDLYETITPAELDSRYEGDPSLRQAIDAFRELGEDGEPVDWEQGPLRIAKCLAADCKADSTSWFWLCEL